VSTDNRLFKESLRAVVRDFGTPCYVYFMDQVRDRVARVRAAFGSRFRISYAVKCNPNGTLLRRLQSVVDILDVSSAGEARRAVLAGWDPINVSFTGPAKTAVELQTSVDMGIGEVILESIDEAALLNRLAEQSGKRQRVLVRIGPQRVPRGFGLHMSGKPSQFGIDEEEVDHAVQAIESFAHLDLCGFHIYSGTQCLNAEAVAENYGIFIDVFKRVCRTRNVSPHRLIFGSGIGIPYFDTDTPVDLTAIAERTNPVIDAFKQDPLFSGAELVLEMGRYLVGEAGVYLTRVVRMKRSRGVVIGICDGGMHHHLAAAGHLGTLIQRNYGMLKITEDDPATPEEVYTLVGSLCTTLDTLGRQVKFNGLEAGDVIGILCSGAYGVSASPIHFISHPPPKEIILETGCGDLLMEDCSELTAWSGSGSRESET
jgi:diaminopimelate decarboxylase